MEGLQVNESTKQYVLGNMVVIEAYDTVYWDTTNYLREKSGRRCHKYMQQNEK